MKTICINCGKWIDQGPYSTYLKQFHFCYTCLPKEYRCGFNNPNNENDCLNPIISFEDPICITHKQKLEIPEEKLVLFR